MWKLKRDMKEQYLQIVILHLVKSESFLTL